MVAGDIQAAAALHRQVLGMEFISRCGPRFVRRYYRAWMEAPAGLALVAATPSGGVAGVLLGATDPPAHTAGMVRDHGAALGAAMAAATVIRPRLAREVLATRVGRYARGIWRIVRPRRRAEAPPAAPTPATGTAASAPPARAGEVAEVTHLLVAPDHQGQGVGRALVDAATAAAHQAGRTEVVLVTPPDMAARQFYERLGWVYDGPVVSRSGEPFVRYRLPIG
jgi:GNAT superfamily N-acetyltransferase